MASLAQLKALIRGEKSIPDETKWNEVLIIGDSFAKQRSYQTDWPFIVTSTLTEYIPNFNKSVRGKGFSGASWWSSRRLLIKELEINTPKVLIMTHTEMQRIPSDDDYGLNSASVFNVDYYSTEATTNRLAEENLTPKEVLIAGQEYYKHLFSKDFHLWAQKKWFEEIDELVTTYNIPYVIHMHAFEPWEKHKTHVFKNGVTFTTPLWEISDDIKLMKNVQEVAKNVMAPSADMWVKNNTRNHFNEENNLKLANVVLNAINTYSNGPRQVQL